MCFPRGHVSRLVLGQTSTVRRLVLPRAREALDQDSEQSYRRSARASKATSPGLTSSASPWSEEAQDSPYYTMAGARSKSVFLARSPQDLWLELQSRPAESVVGRSKRPILNTPALTCKIRTFVL